MTPRSIPHGTVHQVPADLRAALLRDARMRATWLDVTPLARNEWICWITSAKQQATRERRLRIGRENLAAGTRRPCCWAGCPHR